MTWKLNSIEYFMSFAVVTHLLHWPLEGTATAQRAWLAGRRWSPDGHPPFAVHTMN